MDGRAPTTRCDVQELEFILKSSSTVGYRPHVFSTTLSHLIATNCPQLILPLVPIREMLKEKVEEFFGCDFELCIEFTGLISGSKPTLHKSETTRIQQNQVLQTTRIHEICYVLLQG
ncbi:hypothetical protein SAY86_003133 [Trapa natans]|uniref:Uncharacterized protein n=1 Tax=Trapa natans TaxID=22666 RepID=A0AAN7LKB6_TRANT|nr:hypothetical protein SAY86_003133 [Trapa natans]